MSLGDMVDSTSSTSFLSPSSTWTSDRVHSQIHARNSHHHSNLIIPQSHQNFHPVPTVKLLEIMIKIVAGPPLFALLQSEMPTDRCYQNSCRCDRSASHDPLSTTQGSSTSTSSHCNRIRPPVSPPDTTCRSVVQISEASLKYFNKPCCSPHPVEGNSSSLRSIDLQRCAHIVRTRNRPRVCTKRSVGKDGSGVGFESSETEFRDIVKERIGCGDDANACVAARGVCSNFSSSSRTRFF